MDERMNKDISPILEKWNSARLSTQLDADGKKKVISGKMRRLLTEGISKKTLLKTGRISEHKKEKISFSWTKFEYLKRASGRKDEKEIKEEKEREREITR